MNLAKLWWSLSIAGALAFSVATTADAQTAYIRQGSTCTGPAAGSYTPGGTTTLSVCIDTLASSKGVCSYSIQPEAAVGESGNFVVQNGTVLVGYAANGSPGPVTLNNPADPNDFGATFNGIPFNVPAAADQQKLATFDLVAQAGATAASYTISLSAFSEAIIGTPGASCGSAVSFPISPSITLTKAVAPAITSAATANFTFGTAGTFTIVATGAPAPSLTASGFPTAGLSFTAATGVISGTPNAAGSFTSNITASNASGTAMQTLTVNVAKANQTITFNNPGTQAFNASPFASGATADSGLTPVLTSTTLSVCTVTGLNINFIAAGTCTINANQAGNANYNAAAQVPQTFTITASPPGAPTGVSGAALNNSATISFSAPAATGGAPITGYAVTCRDVPTNTVTGTDTQTGTTALSHLVTGLVNGTAYTCTVIASNANGPGPASAASAPFTPAPTPVPPAFTTGTAVGPLTFGAAMATFNIAANGVPAPTITAPAAPAGLTFTSGGANSGTATLTGTPNAAGTFNLLVTATGTAPPATQTLVITVNKAAQTITFANPGAKTFSATPFAITATATSGLAVTFTSTTPTFCSVTGTNVTMIAVGNCTIAADQAGNANYNAAPQVTQTFAITQAPQTITFGAQAARPFSAVASSLSPLATASSGLPVSYTSTTPAVCSITGSSVTTNTLGTCTIQANQAGNVNFSAAAPVSQSFNITIGTQVINFSNPPDTAVNAQPFSLAPFAAATSGLVVTFASTTPSVCTTTGTNGATVTVVVLGTCSITATQAGNANFSAAAPVSRSFQVIPPGAVTLTTSASPAKYRQSVTLTASVVGTNPTGTVTFSLMNSAGTTVLCNAVTLVNATASCVVPGSFLTSPLVYFVANYSGDASNNPNTFTLPQGVNMSAITLTAIATPPADPKPGNTRDEFTISAMVTAATPSNDYRVNFSENGGNLCTNALAQPLPGSNDIYVVSCTLNTGVSDGKYGARTFVVTLPHLTDAGFEQVFVNYNLAANAPLNYTDMWWVGTSENGWGVSITQHGLNQFIVLYVYDDSGKPVWYVLPQGTWNASNTAFTGQLYQPTSSPFSSYNTAQFNPFGAAGGPVGSATITYNSFSTATLTYTINGKSGTKSIQRQVFGADDGQRKLQVRDMWWAGPSQNGWGMNIAQQGRVLFPVWYTYDSTGTTRFYAVPGGTWVGNTFTGDIYTTSSSAWLGANYIAANFIATKVGTMSLTFEDQGSAIMTYTVNGVTQTKIIVRQPF